MTDAFLVLDDVSKSFGTVQAVRNVSMEIEAGEFVALMGPSGCGKTTTLRMIAGLDRPSTGEIRLDGVRMNELKPWRRDTPLVWQSFALFPFMTVFKNVEFGLRMRKVDKATRRRTAMDWLERLGIGELSGRDVNKLSGGQQQRVALARALVAEPRVLLLDEPFSALDAHLRVQMQSELTRLHRQLGITFVFVTHAQSEALAMASRVAVMNEGRIVQIGAPLAVYRAPTSRFVAEFVGMNNILSGPVSRLSGNEALVQTEFASLCAPLPPSHGIAPGDRISVVIGADRITLSADDVPSTENVVRGTVLAQEFVGAMITVFLELAPGVEFRIQKQQHELQGLDLTIGSTLTAWWTTEHAYVLPQSDDDR